MVPKHKLAINISSYFQVVCVLLDEDPDNSRSVRFRHTAFGISQDLESFQRLMEFVRGVTLDRFRHV